MNNFLSRFAVMVAVGAAMSIARPAQADDKAEAQALHERGLKRYQNEDYASAINDYRAAYRLFPAPGILFNLGHAYRLAGDCAQARQAYSRFLREAEGSKQASVARKHLGELGDCQEVPLSLPSDSLTSKLGADASGRAPSEPAIPAAPAGPSLGVRSTPKAEQSRPELLYGVVAGGVGAVLIVGGLVYGLDARSQSQQVDDFIAGGGQWNSELEAIEADGRRSEEIAIVSSVAGGALLIGGGVLYWLSTRAPIRSSRVSVVSTGEETTLLWSGRF